MTDSKWTENNWTAILKTKARYDAKKEGLNISYNKKSRRHHIDYAGPNPLISNPFFGFPGRMRSGREAQVNSVKLIL